jgi:serine/threonine protein kinase
MAPEIVQKKEYRGEPADVWALGVLTFVTLTGIFPFRGATDQELYRKINNAEYPRHELYFSKEISDLVNRMLRINPDDRITAEEVYLSQCRSLRILGFGRRIAAARRRPLKFPSAASARPFPPTDRRRKSSSMPQTMYGS